MREGNEGDVSRESSKRHRQKELETERAKRNVMYQCNVIQSLSFNEGEAHLHPTAMSNATFNLLYRQFNVL